MHAKTTLYSKEDPRGVVAYGYFTFSYISHRVWYLLIEF